MSALLKSALRVVPRLLELESRDVPSGVPLEWSDRGSGGGGALFSPSINPAAHDEIYIASDMSQLFRTANGGDTWTTTDFRQLGGNREARVQFTNDPNVRYALDYSVVNGYDLVRPSKTMDAGQTWTPLSVDPTSGGAYYFFADPNNYNRLAITTYSKLYLSTDGGGSWSQRFATSSSAGLLVGGAFWDGPNLFFGTNQGLLTSTNGGASFSVAGVGGLPAGQSLISFAGGKVGGITRFVGITWNSENVYAGLPGYNNNGGANVVTLDVGSPNWTVRTLPSGSWPFFAGMAGNDVNTLYAAGGSSDGKPTVFKSGDAGASWSGVLLTTNNANVATGWSGSGGDRGWWYGGMALGFTVAANDANRLVITDFGFAHASTDGGTSWQALYVNPADRNPAGLNTPTGKSYRSSGLDNTTSWDVTWADNGNIFIGNSDIRGQLSTSGGATFGFGYSGHTRNSMYRVVKAPNGTLYGAAASTHDLYQSTYLQDSRIDNGNGAVMMSTNHGLTWSTLRDFGRNVVWVALDPNNPERLFASVVHSTQGGIWKTENLSAGTAATWVKLTNPPRTEGHPFNIVVLDDGSIVASYSGRRSSSGAFTTSSGVFHSTDGGATWADRSAPGMIYWTKDVVIDPHDPSQNTWYAGVFSGWGGPPNNLGGLYKTTDRGLNWTRVLNLHRVTSATFNPTDPDELFITTETEGLWYTSNIRSASPTYSQVASYPFRQPERVFFNPANANEIWVTSFGGGVRVGVNHPAPPTTEINGGDPQRSRITSILVNFPAAVDVTALNAPGAVVLTQTAGPNPGTIVQSGATGGNGRILVSPAFGITNGILLTFDHANGSAASIGVEHGSFADGRWQLAIPSWNYSSEANDASLRRLFGDWNGDGNVDGIDFAQFGAVFGKASTAFDFDGNGIVDALDFAQFGSRFGMSL